MTTVSLRMDDDMKKQLDSMCSSIGINISTFFMIYAKKALRERAIPFPLTADADIFYSKSNMDALKVADEQVKNNEVVVKTFEELKTFEK